MTDPEHMSYPTFNNLGVNVPEFFVCLPDDEERIEKVKDKFFLAVVKALGYADTESLVECEVRSREILKAVDGRTVQEHEDLATNDRITELLVRGRTVASVLATRTEFNAIQASFGYYITSEMDKIVRFNG